MVLPTCISVEVYLQVIYLVENKVIILRAIDSCLKVMSKCGKMQFDLNLKNKKEIDSLLMTKRICLMAEHLTIYSKYTCQ